MKTKNIYKSNGMKKIFQLLFSEYKWHLLFVILGILGSALATVKGTLFLQTLIDDYITPLISSDNPDFQLLFQALLKMGCIYGVGLICSFAYNRIMVNVGQGTMKKVRTQLFTHMESLPIKYFDTHAHGDIMSVYTNDTDTLRQFVGISLPQLLNSFISIISVFVSMVILNVPLTILTVAMVVVMLISTRFIAGKSGKYFGKQQQHLGEVNGYIEEMMGGQKVIKVFCHEEESLKEFRVKNEQLRDSADKANGYANILMPVIVQLGNVSYVLCAIAGGTLALNGYAGLTIGTLISFLTLNKSFNQPFGQISQQLNSVIMAQAGIDRIYTLLDEVPETDEGHVTLVNANIDDNGNITESPNHTGKWAWKDKNPTTGETVFEELRGDIVFTDVDFGYTDEKMVLHNINLFAHEGQKIAFVGSTGAGKTTITNLINRFYDIQKGSIKYDGIDIGTIKKADLRRSLGIVLQDTHLFTGTVMDNIRYGRLDATDEECIAAAKLANANSFIKHLPDGYNTFLTGDGANLSQGQRQLIAIARAAVADPPVLILDEATSSIDTRTERIVQEGMDALMEGRTTFVIAHRLSTIRNANLILVVNEGRIVEQGTHKTLMEKNGFYASLYRAQFE